MVMDSFSLLETMRLEDGQVPRLERHLTRMASAARHFGYPWNEQAVRLVEERFGFGLRGCDGGEREGKCDPQPNRETKTGRGERSENCPTFTHWLRIYAPEMTFDGLPRADYHDFRRNARPSPRLGHTKESRGRDPPIRALARPDARPNQTYRGTTAECGRRMICDWSSSSSLSSRLPPTSWCSAWRCKRV